LSQLLWWHWLAFGLLLSVAELAVPSLILIWFGAGALLVGLVLGFFPSMALAGQLAIWLSTSLAFVALWFRFFRPSDAQNASSEMLGEVGLITHAIDGFGQGRIRLQRPYGGREEWPADADQPIREGERARVISFEGERLTVTPLNP
jgi:membrane protein implicated in regulation of membrane protease activity